ncbi:hypothetical protein [Sphingopyxis indica]|uniref:HNH endonuclease 5 domain-containing protein n=1 Tax=Sphingopyxis indica TaxID=436663 RepID=A0A239IM15_9SPHN|nr:hypothetical protein [Sphingopyxis indica]SNS94615.1 hypothetical protein SAMN06295955_10860 [Sphingopyxis indica]
MYDPIVQELVEPSSERRFLGERTQCRYCGVTGAGVFGSRTNAHALPAALGNRTLFALDECKACNARFSIYEDALCKAVGPFLTLGGVRGRNGVRQTGQSRSRSTVRHAIVNGKRQLSVAAQGDANALVDIDKATGQLKLTMPVEGDVFVPRYAYKALMKIGLSMLPGAELPRFCKAIASLADHDAEPHKGPLLVGFSHAYVGNSPPALAGTLLRRRDATAPLPYMIFVLMAGSVCFQIWLRSDDLDEHVPEVGRLGVRFTAQLPKPEGGYLPIAFSDPLQFDWSALTSALQPFEAFELTFDPRTTAASFRPIAR